MTEFIANWMAEEEARRAVLGQKVCPYVGPRSTGRRIGGQRDGPVRPVFPQHADQG